MKDGIVITFGRFNPPTLGHRRLFETIYNLANTKKYEHGIYLSHSQDNKKNPLSYEEKLFFLTKIYPKYNFVKSDARNIFDVLKDLNGKYKNVLIVIGSDREDFIKKVLDYNGKIFNFENINYLFLERGEDRFENSISATKAREAVLNNDFEMFKKIVGDNKYTIELFNLLKERLEKKKIKKSLKEVFLEFFIDK